MSLNRVRWVYTGSVILIAVLLVATGSPAYWIAAAVLLTGSPLLFRALNGASELTGATKALQRLHQRLMADEAPGEADPHH